MKLAGEFGSLRHLAGRFFGSLSPAGPSPQDEGWVRDQLLAGERDLWRRMSGPDRRHAVAVARETVRLLDDGGEPPGREVVASALLHDVGKIESGLGPFARAAVTLAAIAFARSRLIRPVAPTGAAGRWRERARLYLTHDSVGGELLRRAGADPVTVSWAEQHHLEPDRWSLDPRQAQALKDADGD